MRSTAELEQYAVRLRRAAPREFEEFCKAFDQYAGNTLRDIIDATPADLQRVQGSAQQCKKILDVFIEARRS